MSLLSRRSTYDPSLRLVSSARAVLCSKSSTNHMPKSSPKSSGGGLVEKGYKPKRALARFFTTMLRYLCSVSEDMVEQLCLVGCCVWNQWDRRVWSWISDQMGSEEKLVNCRQWYRLQQTSEWSIGGQPNSPRPIFTRALRKHLQLDTLMGIIHEPRRQQHQSQHQRTTSHSQHGRRHRGGNQVEELTIQRLSLATPCLLERLSIDIAFCVM